MRTSVKPAILLFLFLSSLLFGGCGYELVQDRGIFGGEIASLSFPIFKNRTYEPQAPGIFTEAFSRELAASGRFDLNRAASDATLQGTITSISAVPSSLSTQGLALEKVVTAVITLTLTRQGNLVKSWSFSDVEAYAVNDINLEDFNKRQALARIAARMGRRFHSQLLTDY